MEVVNVFCHLRTKIESAVAQMVDTCQRLDNVPCARIGELVRTAFAWTPQAVGTGTPAAHCFGEKSSSCAHPEEAWLDTTDLNQRTHAVDCMATCHYSVRSQRP